MQKNESEKILLSIIVPVYNESARIYHLKTIIEYCKSELRDKKIEIIISDDGSTDDTILKAEEILSKYHNSKIVKNPQNRGKGHAITTGMQSAQGQYRVFMDIDLSTPLKHLKTSLEKVVEYDVVIGTRKNANAKVVKHQSWLRENMGKGFTSLSKFILSTPVSDFTCGFKIFSKSAAEKIFSNNKIERWAFDSEILFLARKFGYKICEMPVEWKNDDDTRVKMGRVIIPTFIDLLKIRFGKYDFEKTNEFVDITTKLEYPKSNFNINQKISNSTVLIVFGVFLITLKLLIFLATQDVGMEHDSAWYLGVAKNFAQNGKYASFTNTAATSKPISVSIHNRITVQDKDGYVYFPAGVTAGPTYVIPQAIFMKIFGFGFWQYRIWPILGYVLLLFTLFYLARQYGGVISLVIMIFVVWARSDIFINYSFEAFSEHIALLFALFSLILANKSYDKQDSHNPLLLSGLLFGLSIMAKNLTFILAPGVLFLFLPTGGFKFSELRVFARKSISWLLGVMLPPTLFIVYELAYTNSIFGKGGFAGVATDFILHWKMGGGGITGFNPQFAYLKMMVLNHAGNANIFLFLLFIFILPAYLFREWNNKKEVHFVKALFIMFLSNYAWFIYIAASGWTRHMWMGLIIFLLIVTIIFSHLLRKFSENGVWNIYAVVVGIIIFSIVVHEHANYSITMSKNKFISMWANSFLGATPNRLQGFVFSPIFSWKDLQDVTSFLKKNEYKNKKMYYAQTFLVTEVATELMKPMYPVVRQIDDKDEGILIIGPYQKGELNLLSEDYELSIKSAYCKKTIYQNLSYSVCQTSKEKIKKFAKK